MPIENEQQLIELVRRVVEQHSPPNPIIRFKIDGAYSSGKPKVLRPGDTAVGTDLKNVLVPYAAKSGPVAGEEAVGIMVGNDVVVLGAFGVPGLQASDWFGAGPDGNVTISSNTSLTADMFYNNLTVNAGVVLSTDGYRIFAKGIVTVNGTISNNGSPGSGPTAGLGATGNYFRAGANGGAGSESAGAAGSSITAPSAGGNGGTGKTAGGTGGTGGNVTAGLTYWRFHPSLAVLGGIWSGNAAATLTMIAGGAGGGGGGGTAGNSGGGGGGGGGVVALYANTIVVNSGGAIQANGGNGGNGTGTGAGGGGGGGGSMLLAYRSLTNSGTIQAASGTQGAGGTGSAAAVAGTVVQLALVN